MSSIEQIETPVDTEPEVTSPGFVRRNWNRLNVASGGVLFVGSEVDATDTFNLPEAIDPTTYGRHYLPTYAVARGLLRLQEYATERDLRPLAVSAAFMLNTLYEFNYFVLESQLQQDFDSLADVSDIACGAVACAAALMNRGD